MSPRWIDALVRRRTHRLRVYLGTRRVTAELLAGWRTPRVVQGVSLPLAAGGIEAAIGTFAEALRALRARQGSLRQVPCDVVIADGWLAYDVIAIDVLQMKAASAGSAVIAALADVCGARAETLDVRWQWQADGRSVFAMATPRALLGRVRGVLATAGIVPASVTGEFVAVYNAQRTRLKGRRVVLAVGREAGAQIALLVDGVIRATRFELGRNGASLSSAAAGVMRERGDDTTTPTDYVLDTDPQAGFDDATLDGRWARLRTPAWLAAGANAAMQ